jgi:hypothetical protein
MFNVVGIVNNVWVDKHLAKLRRKMPRLRREKEMDTTK